jgi:hypothetical protein
MSSGVDPINNILEIFPITYSCIGYKGTRINGHCFLLAPTGRTGIEERHGVIKLAGLGQPV